MNVLQIREPQLKIAVARISVVSAMNLTSSKEAASLKRVFFILSHVLIVSL